MMKDIADQDHCHWHPLVHFASGRRLYYFLIQSSGDFTEVEKLLSGALKELGLYSSSCAYLVFGNFDFIIRVWSKHSPCNDFEKKLSGFQQAKDIKFWKKLFVSTLDTWTQRRIEDSIRQRGIKPSDLDGLWSKPATHFPQLSYDTTNAVPDELKSTRFFMFLEEPFEAEQKAFRVLRDDLTGATPEGLQTWSLYSYYTETEGFRGTTNERGVLFTGYITSLAEHSDFLVKLPMLLTRKISQLALGFKPAGSDREHSFSSVTYICSRSIKTQEGKLEAHSEENSYDSKREIAINLLASHDNHDFRYRQGEKRRKIQERFVLVVSELDFDLWFSSYFIRLHDWPDWWKSISDIRLIYKFLVFGRKSQVEQMLIRNYVRTEQLLVGLFTIKETRNSDQTAIEIIVSKLKGKTPIEIAKYAYAKGSSSRKPTGKLTLGELAPLFTRIAESPRLGERDRIVLRGIVKHLDEFARHRNDCLHGNWKELGTTEIKAVTADYTWVAAVKNYMEIVLRLPEVIECCRRLQVEHPNLFELIRGTNDETLSPEMLERIADLCRMTVPQVVDKLMITGPSPIDQIILDPPQT